MWRYLIPVGIFAILIAFFFAGLGRDKETLPSPLIGRPAPEFTLPRLEDPTELVSSKDFAGRKYLVNVWGPWCAACYDEHPALLEIARRKVLPIVGLTVPQGALADQQGKPLPLEDVLEEMQRGLRWISELGNPYDVTVFDQMWTTAIDFGVYGAPETFLIDEEGVVVHKHVGPIDLTVWERDFMPKINASRSAGG
ncbi:MAG: DsbE family thiol:disulfide interchange protein [Gammaproteobacteria bacterium]|nr:DsbE family thiol:disulfide interchange protein [Gammaproteobacteria bacterium]